VRLQQSEPYLRHSQIKAFHIWKISVTGFFNGYNLNNDRIRELYTALTGDEVEKTSFWEKFKASAKRRNNIIHSALMVAKAEAEESYLAAKDLVAHLKK
jgi:hypothetical protein